jgi:hypothetical protein
MHQLWMFCVLHLLDASVQSLPLIVQLRLFGKTYTNAICDAKLCATMPLQTGINCTQTAPLKLPENSPRYANPVSGARVYLGRLSPMGETLIERPQNNLTSVEE